MGVGEIPHTNGGGAVPRSGGRAAGDERAAVGVNANAFTWSAPECSVVAVVGHAGSVMSHSRTAPDAPLVATVRPFGLTTILAAVSTGCPAGPGLRDGRDR